MSSANTRLAPNFGLLLQDAISSVPASAMPALLAALERGAAGRYRTWASQDDAHRAGLLACSGREDEIARRVDELHPVDGDVRKQIQAVLPGAVKIYLQVFEGLALLDQLRIQADAERQGAAAWRGIASGLSDARAIEVLEGCAALEEESADYLDSVVSGAAD